MLMFHRELVSLTLFCRLLSNSQILILDLECFRLSAPSTVSSSRASTQTVLRDTHTHLSLSVTSHGAAAQPIRLMKIIIIIIIE